MSVAVYLVLAGAVGIGLGFVVGRWARRRAFADVAPTHDTRVSVSTGDGVEALKLEFGALKSEIRYLMYDRAQRVATMQEAAPPETAIDRPPLSPARAPSSGRGPAKPAGRTTATGTARDAAVGGIVRDATAGGVVRDATAGNARNAAGGNARNAAANGASRDAATSAAVAADVARAEQVGRVEDLLYDIAEEQRGIRAQLTRLSGQVAELQAEQERPRAAPVRAASVGTTARELRAVPAVEPAPTVTDAILEKMVAGWNQLDWKDAAVSQQIDAWLARTPYRMSAPVQDVYCLFYVDAVELDRQPLYVFPVLHLMVSNYKIDLFERPASGSTTKLVKPAQVRLDYPGPRGQQLEMLTHADVGLSELRIEAQGQLA